MDLRAPLEAGLTAVAECLGMLCGAKVSSRLPKATHVGPAALEVVGGDLVWCETRALAEPQRKVGLALSAALAKRLGAAMLMLRAPPAGLSNELLKALDECLNIAIGVWNIAVEYEALLWSSDLDARTIRPRGLEEVLAECDEHGLGVVLGTLELEGATYPIAIFGHGAWPAVEGFDPPRRPRGLGAFSPKVRDAIERGLSTPRRVAAPPTPAEPEPHTSAADPRGPRQPLLLLVDRTGALRAWLAEQMRNPTFVFHRGDGSEGTRPDCRALVLVEPSGSELPDLRAERTLVMELR